MLLRLLIVFLIDQPTKAETITITVDKNQTKYITIPTGKIAAVYQAGQTNQAKLYIKIGEVYEEANNGTGALYAGPIKIRINGHNLQNPQSTSSGLITFDIADQKSPKSGAIISSGE